MNLYTLMTYQRQGFIACGTATNQVLHAEANKRINSAREATPEKYRGEFRSVITWRGDGYSWAWILK